VSIPVREPHESRVRRRRGVRGQAFDVLTRCFADAVGADTAALLTRQGGKTHVLSDWAAEGHELSVAWTGETLLGRTFTAESPLLEYAASQDPAADGNRTIVAVAGPVHSHRDVLGALYAGFSPPSSANHSEVIWATESYARLAALSMTEDVTIAAVLGSVGFDVLTGCLSYGGLIEVLKSEIQRSDRNQHRLSCCFIDLDGFKHVNDQQGHLEGNRVLAAVGAALRETARAYDAVGRFGGDEFVVVLPETGARAGTVVAQRFRAAARGALAESTAVPLDVSVGVVEWNGTGAAQELLEAADQALRDAKQAGGARVTNGSAPALADGLLELTRDLMRKRRASGVREPDTSE
jgi:diguanylate cyclase (GGDEF)-like protein